MNNSSIEKNDVISTDEDLGKLPEVNPKIVSPHKISNLCKAWYHIGIIDDNFDFEFSPENLFNSSHLLDSIYTLPSSLQKSNDKFSLLHINCRSIINKLQDIQMLIGQCDANIIALTETWLNVGNENSVSIKGYNFVSKCSVVSRGGGVGFFVSDNISFKIIDLVSLNIIVTYFEILLLKIVQRRSSDFYVAVVYRHPDCNMKVFNLEFFNFSNYFSNRLSFILGDFNVDLLTAFSLQSSSQFYNNVASCSLLPVSLNLLELHQTHNL